MNLAAAAAAYGAAWLTFGAGHSLLARETVKGALRPLLGRAYRLSYNVVALIHLMLVLALGWWLLSPFGEFTLPPWADGVRLGTLIVGAAVLWIGGGSYDLRRLAGVAQLRETPDAQDPDDEPLRIEGIQRHVRHPLYLGTLLVVWGLAGSPFGLCTAIGATVYILVGIRYEERDLVRRFGDRYGDYRRRVPMLFPWPGRHA